MCGFFLVFCCFLHFRWRLLLNGHLDFPVLDCVHKKHKEPQNQKKNHDSKFNAQGFVPMVIIVLYGDESVLFFLFLVL